MANRHQETILLKQKSAKEPQKHNDIIFAFYLLCAHVVHIVSCLSFWVQKGTFISKETFYNLLTICCE